MYLVRLRLTRLGPFDDAELSFADEGEPRKLTVISGGGAVGKTTLIAAIAATRPGHAVVPSSLHRDPEEPGHVIAEYFLGHDEPERPHPLIVATPSAQVFPSQELESQRRREQAVFDKLARESGFAYVGFPASRGFSRQPLALHSPGRTLAKYDVRAPAGIDDASRLDLARETKQCLAYAAITSALESKQSSGGSCAQLMAAMQQAVDTLGALVGLRWVGLEPLSLEPRFETQAGASETFDQLSTRARHLIAFAAVTVRALWASAPARSTLDLEGLVTIDEVDLHLDPALQAKLPEALRAALPRVQWVLTATSPYLASACDAAQVIALRRSPDRDGIELYSGHEARTH